MRKALFVIVIVFLSFISTARAGDSIGRFCWQLDPYSDVICFDIELTSLNTFALIGDFSSTTYKYPVTGNVIYDPYNLIYRMQFQSAVIYDGRFVNFALGANLNTLTLAGNWKTWSHITRSELSGTTRFLGSGADIAEADLGEGRRGMFED